ncbi:MAG: glycosyltransferase [Candidatus Eisenbacteria bacterium]|nr:glycosyltransferase [Candidatus Eisenbacteria bacterium]
MARILQVKPHFPYPPHQGTRRVSLSLLGDLASAHEVLYLCQRETRAEAALIPEVERLGARVVAPLMPNKRSPLHRALYKLQNQALARIQRRPPICYYWSNQVLRGALERWSREFRPDLTILESWETFPLRRSIRHGRAVLLAHDAAFQIRERAAAAATDPAERRRRARRSQREKALEVASWALYDAILTLTEADRHTIEQELALRCAAGTTATDQRAPTPESPSDGTRAAAGPAPAVHLPPVRHLPMPVAEAFFEFSRPPQLGQRVGFLGTFRADFNRDALEHLLRDLWPAIRARVPQAELIVAGNGYEGPLREGVLQAGGRWLGFVDDLRAYYESIDLLLVPLRFGAGLRIRILEALAAAAPVVASPIAVASLGLTDGEQYREAETPAEVATAVAALLADPAAAQAMGRRGRDWCRREHGPEVIRPRRLAVIDELLVGSATA